MDLRRVSECFDRAREALRLPHKDEASSVARAMGHCRDALRALDDGEVDSDDANRNLTDLREVLDTADVEDSDGVGTDVVRARQMDFEDKAAFARAVDELAGHFDREFWDSGRV